MLFALCVEPEECALLPPYKEPGASTRKLQGLAYAKKVHWLISREENSKSYMYKAVLYSTSQRRENTVLTMGRAPHTTKPNHTRTVRHTVVVTNTGSSGVPSELLERVGSCGQPRMHASQAQLRNPRRLSSHNGLVALCELAAQLVERREVRGQW